MNVAIAGFGIEGRANLAYWQSKGDTVTILDEKVVSEAPDHVQVLSGVDAFRHLDAYDLVVRTASLRPDKLGNARKVWSATNEFFSQCPAPIIGVTGTKGKGTTSSLIASILRAAGKTVHLVGNIGVPALEVLPMISPDDVVVFELSSFQLWDLEKSPHIAVVLMIEPDHMDVHASMDEYIAAKSRIAASQTPADTVIYHPTNQYSRTIAETTAGKKVRYGVMQDGGVYVESNNFCVHSTAICNVSSLQIVGQHNIENACAAISAVRAFDDRISFSDIEIGLQTFAGLPHRLKLIREIDGVRYFDDNYSSAPGATIAAVRSFTEPEIVIVGGYDKGVAFSELAAGLAAQPNLKHILLIGQTKDKIAAALDAVGLHDRYELRDDTTLASIVERARSIAGQGDVVIMSPGCASFDMFTNFSERGDQFIAIVERL